MKFSLDSSIAFYIILLVEWMKYCHLIANHSFEQLKHSLISKNVGGAPCYYDGKCDLLNVLSVFFFSSRPWSYNMYLFISVWQEACLKFRRVLFIQFRQNLSLILPRETLVNSYRSLTRTFNINFFHDFQTDSFCLSSRSAASC